MNALQQRHLRRYCAKYGLDTAEIDSGISYSENKDHLKTMVPKRLEDLVERGEEQLKEYMADHFLTYYVSCVQSGSAEVKHASQQLPSNTFSLRAWVNLKL